MSHSLAAPTQTIHAPQHTAPEQNAPAEEAPQHPQEQDAPEHTTAGPSTSSLRPPQSSAEKAASSVWGAITGGFGKARDAAADASSAVASKAKSAKDSVTGARFRSSAGSRESARARARRVSSATVGTAAAITRQTVSSVGGVLEGIAGGSMASGPISAATAVLRSELEDSVRSRTAPMGLSRLGSYACAGETEDGVSVIEVPGFGEITFPEEYKQTSLQGLPTATGELAGAQEVFALPLYSARDNSILTGLLVLADSGAYQFDLATYDAERSR